ncbi:MAG TPA: gluconate 2-dehydrogenase subunit 3 family protein [Acidimicrobiales bacterium]|nr:gluconate 2-dehydrogenase subunit 3 family protein [Acidimicrobiales bacterium]
MPYRPPHARAVTPGGKGRFPGFDTLDQVEFWDDVTAGVVLSRLDPQPEMIFFTPAEQATAGALCDRLLAQDDEPKVPVLLLVDRRLSAGETDGWRYADMPEDSDAWRRTIAALDDDANGRFGRPFHALAVEEQGSIIEDVRTKDHWHGLPAQRVWSLWTRYTSTAFYSHPWAWNEIGFGGPAYPRGYKALGVGKREPWEVADHHQSDPVQFEQRVHRATASHAQVTGDQGA